MNVFYSGFEFEVIFGLKFKFVIDIIFSTVVAIGGWLCEYTELVGFLLLIRENLNNYHILGITSGLDPSVKYSGNFYPQ